MAPHAGREEAARLSRPRTRADDRRGAGHHLGRAHQRAVEWHVGCHRIHSYVAETGAGRDLDDDLGRRAVRGGRRQQALGDNTPITTDDLWKRAAKDMSNKPYKALGTDLLAASQRDRERALDTFAQAKHWIDDAVRQDPGIAVKVADRVRAEAIDTSLGRQRLGLEASIAENARC